MNYPIHIETVDKDIKLGVKWSSRKDAEPSGVWYAIVLHMMLLSKKTKGK